MNDPQLTKAVTEYHAAKAARKQVQKTELEEYLKPWAADIGDEIKRVRSERGASIEDIGNIIGIRNRTFIYNMIHASDERSGTRSTRVNTVRDPEPIAMSGNEFTPGHRMNIMREYTLEYFSGVVRVTFSEDESYDIAVIDGVPDIPEEWAEHTSERRAKYKDIIAEIKANVDRIE